MLLKKKDRRRMRGSKVSVREVSHVLIDEWRRWKSVAQIKDIIQVAVNEYRFDVNAVEDGESVLDKLCCPDDADIILPIVTSLVAAGATPVLKNSRHLDIIEECISRYDFKHYLQPDTPIAQQRGIDLDTVIDHVTILLKHGARINNVQQTDGGLQLTSRCLRWLLTYSADREWNWYRMQLVILLLVHGAFWSKLTADPLLAIAGIHDDGPYHTLTSIHDFQRLVRYFVSAGYRLYSCFLHAYTHGVIPREHLSDRDMQIIEILQEMRSYTRSLTPRPESLQFKCRHVIRRRMSIAADGKSILNGIDNLQIPVILRDYLKLKDAE